MASAASIAPTNPFVSIIPNASVELIFSSSNFFLFYSSHIYGNPYRINR
jgi:hypothetical protein